MQAPPSDPVDDLDFAALVDGVIAHRRHVRFRCLGGPALSDAVVRSLIDAAAAAPDHRQLRPWRFIAFRPESRAELGDWFAQALLERDPGAGAPELARAREKAHWGATLLLAIVDLRTPEPEVPDFERVVSLGAAIQNLLLAATARGLGSGLGGGRALSSSPLRAGLGLAPGEHAVCFIALGAPDAEPDHRPRPTADDVLSWH